MTASRKPVRVRPATLDDLPFLMALSQELKNTRGVSEARLTEAVAAAIGDHERHLVLAVSGPDDAEEALGMSLFSISSANPLFDVPAVHISHTVVSDKHRRRGAGRALLAAATGYAEDLGIEQLVISVDPGSRESARFFARLGFVPLAVRRTAPVALVRRKLSPGTSRLRAVTEPAPDRSRLLLLDGHSLAYRAFFALPVENFSTTDGQPTNAVYGFTAMLINVLRDEAPTHVAVSFDISRSNFRHDAYADYKAGRAETPADFKGQVSLVREVLDALRIPVVCAEGYEADDVIATLATQAAADGMDVLIVTGDRDAFQLVDERVTVLYNARGVSDMRRMTPAAVEEKYGLTPAQYPEFAALRGDPSDNLPGIPGLGEKTATKLIQQYGDVANLVDHVDEVKGKVGDNLREGIASVVRNRMLTELVRTVPLEVQPS